MALQDEINEMARVIHTDGYPMSIGELASIYKDKELDIHPEFQRFFRWDSTQKSNLIESILLGIPIPPIFVSQNEKNMWDVIDGLQRLSTIFEFMGILRDKEEKIQDPSELTKTKFLPSLDGKYWDKNDDEENSLTVDQRLLIKRSKLDIKIIKTSSSPKAKYDLFQRLNTGGTHLSPQEIRNCLLIMINKVFFENLNLMNEYSHFRNCIPLSDNNLEQQVDMEFVVRFIVSRHCNFENINKDENLHEFLTDKITEIAQNEEFDIEAEKQVFEETFEYLNNLLGEDSFRKYNSEKEKFIGPVLISGFEVVVLGISKNIEYIKSKTGSCVKEMIQGIYDCQEFRNSVAHGVRAVDRFKRLSLFSLERFSHED
ncbi:MAG: DUF262 domain-containing protein [Sporomusaceae bacterium]|nr:DUF262 domain-containing protein [Sporomusaceae bacterium]